VAFTRILADTPCSSLLVFLDSHSQAVDALLLAIASLVGALGAGISSGARSTQRARAVRSGKAPDRRGPSGSGRPARARRKS
jgi:hypothetical protein